MLCCTDRITLVIPGRLNEWFIRDPSIVTAKNLLLVRERHDRESLNQIWNDFLSTWETKGALYRFDPEHPEEISIEHYPLEHLVRNNTSTPRKRPVLNCLPDLWIGLSPKVIKDIAGIKASRIGIHKGLYNHALKIYTQRQAGDKEQSEAIDKTFDWLSNGDLRIIRISAAQSTRFLGERIWDTRDAEELLIHSALALARSTACSTPGSFAAGWPLS
jgi:hypothetical protein